MSAPGHGASSPRVDGASLQRLPVGTQVTLLGKVVTAQPLVVQTPDETQISVTLQLPPGTPAGAPLQVNDVLELLGQVAAGTALTASELVNLGPGFSLPTYKRLLQLLPQYPGVFGQAV